ncbi:MAG: thiamine phosphate synthase [Deltaproteobacteria bacterium]|nr:thiamine phosphate synthase [Deltaproteobacteria bacterium]
MNASATRARRLQRFAEVDIYPVTSARHSAGRSSLEILDAVLAAGARIVQLREKDLPLRELFALAQAFRARTAEAGALLMVNDHVDVALAVGADGVHLGLDDLPLAAARRLAPDLILGASTHSIADVERAQADGADVVNVGPVYPTSTREHAAPALGVEGVRAIVPYLRVPFTVMGGIKLDNIDPLLDLGVRHVAVVTAITAAADPEQATRDLRERMRRR